MPDIVHQDSVAVVQRRLEGQGQGAGKDAPRGQPPKKAAATYQETARVKPDDDRITILGIPFGQITPVTQAALAGLVAEINQLRNMVRRYERTFDKRAAGQSDTAVLEPDAFLRTLAATLGQPAGEGKTWTVVLVHVATYEDIRRNAGLLAANSALADVAYRLKDLQVNAVPFAVVGHAGGSNLAAVAAQSEADLDTMAITKTVREHLLSSGYVVGGIDMALAMSVAVGAVGDGESPLLALGRVDHMLRTT